MTHITIKREVLEQAVLALMANIVGSSGRTPMTHRAITSLRTALEAKDVEPVVESLNTKPSNLD